MDGLTTVIAQAADLLTDQPAPTTQPGAAWLRAWTQEDFLRALTQAGAVEAVVGILVGVVVLLYGWRVFKVLVILNAAAVGLVGGWLLTGLAGMESWSLVVALACGLLLGALAWPLMRHVTGLMAAVVGGTVGYFVYLWAIDAAARPDLTPYAWAGALGGGMLFGLVAIVGFNQLVIVFTAFQGSLMAVAGTLALLCRGEALRTRVHTVLNENPYVLQVAVIVPAAAGFFWQLAGARRHRRAKLRAGR